MVRQMWNTITMLAEHVGTKAEQEPEQVGPNVGKLG